MIGDPFIRVWCDECKGEEEVSMTPLARGSWDARNVPQTLRSMGWTVGVDDRLICPDCAAEKDKVER